MTGLQTSLLSGVKVVMKVPNLSCFVMGTPVLERLILGMDCGYPQRMWARLNSSNNSSLVTDRLCDQIDTGDMAVVCVYRDFHAQNRHPRQSY